MIFITENFLKLLEKLKSVKLEDVLIEIEKNKIWLNNFKLIEKGNDYFIFKWYLLSKKVRFLIYFEHYEWGYTPFYIVKKETKSWKNISKENIDDFQNYLIKSIEDLKNWKYKKY